MTTAYLIVLFALVSVVAVMRGRHTPARKSTASRSRAARRARLSGARA